MKIFINQEFKGCGVTSVYAIVVARDEIDAAMLLSQRLDKEGLKCEENSATELLPNMVELNRYERKVYIASDGDY